MTDIIRMKVKGIFVFLPLRATLKQFDLQTAFQTLTAIMLKHSGVVQGEKNGKKKKEMLTQQEHHPNSLNTTEEYMEISIATLCWHNIPYRSSTVNLPSTIQEMMIHVPEIS